MIERQVFSLLSPAGHRGKLAVLIFHRVFPETDPIFPDDPCVKRFDAICQWAARSFNVLSLADGIERLKNQALPPRSLAITFDDGYADNFHLAMPILLKHGICATFFIATGYLDGGIMWNDVVVEAIRRTGREKIDALACGIPNLQDIPLSGVARKRQAVQSVLSSIKYLAPDDRNDIAQRVAKFCKVSLPSDLMMRSTQLLEMRANGMGIGGHTVSHPILSTLSPDQAQLEIWAGKVGLENLLQDRVSLFAYPNGKPGVDYNLTTVSLVKRCGFDAAVTTSPGAAGLGFDPYQIPRFTPWGKSRLRSNFQFARNLMDAGLLANS